MADKWQTYPFEFKGGLISNLSPLQHGVIAPGSARVLRNFEPSIEGGYRRILGYDKYSSSKVPLYGQPKVHGSGQSGTTLILGNIYTAPVAGNTFTVSGVTGTYTIATAGVSYDSTNKRVTLTLTTSLASSPADQAAVTFATGTGVISGLASWNNKAIAVRNDEVFYSTGTSWTKVNVPSYGTVLVNGGSQTGTSLIVDGLTYAPQAGDTFTVAGIEKIYTVTANATVTSGGATLSINPSLASSPADNAAITFLTAYRQASTKGRFEKYLIETTEKVVYVDGVNAPFIWDGTTYRSLNDAPSDVIGAKHVVFFKNHLFFAKGASVAFTATYTDNDFSAANGSGVISVGSNITGLIVFREQLIIFSERRINQLVGNTLSDFVLKPITENIGCVDVDTIQEVGGDIVFLAPDGLRLLSATDRIGDTGLAVVSKPIQKELTNFIQANTSFCSIVIKQKSQYRIFGYNNSTSTDASIAILGTQLSGEQTSAIAWAEIQGMKAYVADGFYTGRAEVLLFAEDDGYVYRMESGNSLDGRNIVAVFSTPFVPINDPRLRKSFYKMFLYTDPVGSVAADVNLKYDFDDEGIIQPETINLTNITQSAAFYGASTSKYGTSTYGAKIKTSYETQLVGSGFTVSVQVVSSSTNPPFALDAMTLEYASHDRR